MEGRNPPDKGWVVDKQQGSGSPCRAQALTQPWGESTPKHRPDGNWEKRQGLHRTQKSIHVVCQTCLGVIPVILIYPSEKGIGKLQIFGEVLFSPTRLRTVTSTGAFHSPRTGALPRGDLRSPQLMSSCPPPRRAAPASLPRLPGGLTEALGCCEHLSSPTHGPADTARWRRSSCRLLEGRARASAAINEALEEYKQSAP